SEPVLAVLFYTFLLSDGRSVPPAVAGGSTCAITHPLPQVVLGSLMQPARSPTRYRRWYSLDRDVRDHPPAAGGTDSITTCVITHPQPQVVLTPPRRES